MRLFGGNKVKEPPAPPPAAPPQPPTLTGKICLVYLPRDMGQAIVAGVHFAGYLWSKPDMIDVIEMGDHKALGDAAHDRWEQCIQKPYDGPRQNRTDYPAYQASGARSLRQFEDDWVYYRLEGWNASNFGLTVESQERADHLSLRTSIAAGKPWELGQRLMKMHKSYLAWERAA